MAHKEFPNLKDKTRDIEMSLPCSSHRLRNERGASMVEYALIAGLVALAAAAGLPAVGAAVSKPFVCADRSLAGSARGEGVECEAAAGPPPSKCYDDDGVEMACP